tara:strand:- start:456 stop:677 length:222 start_codon:yes stop_codon:yes gene_type:complete
LVLEEMVQHLALADPVKHKELMEAFLILYILLLFNLLVEGMEVTHIKQQVNRVVQVEVVRFKIILVEQEILHQ